MSSTSGEDDQSQQGHGSSSNSSGSFEVGQRVFCYHGEVMYEARITNISPSEKDGSIQYSIHYHGWNKNWDEMVSQDRLEHYNAANKEKAASLREKKPKKRTKGRTSAMSSDETLTPSAIPREPGTSAVGRPSTGKKPGPKGKRFFGVNNKATRDSNQLVAEEDDSKVKLSSTIIKIPRPTLNAHLADDKMHFKMEKKLKVPVAEGLVTVSQLLNDWAEARRVALQPGWTEWTGILMAKQTRLLFNGFCHRNCLSNVEMLQAGMMLERLKDKISREEVANKVDKCDDALCLYDITPYHPPMHLVRLMMVAPTIFGKSLATTDNVAASICKVWQDLIQYINERVDELLLDDRYYVPITKEDIDFLSEEEIQNTSVDFYSSKLSICRQKVIGEKAKTFEHQVK